MKKEQRKKILSIELKVLIAYVIFSFTIIMLLKYFPAFTVPIFFSFFIAYLFNPLVIFLMKKTGLKRSKVSATLMIMLVLILSVFMVSVVPSFLEEAKIAVSKLPHILETFANKIKSGVMYFNVNYSQLFGKIGHTEELKDLPTTLITRASGFLTQIYNSVYGVFNVLAYIIFVPLFAFYFLKDYPKIIRGFYSLIPVRYRKSFFRKVQRVDKILSGFVRGQAIVVLILAVLYSLGLSLIGLPFAILVGVLSGVGDFIPYVGTLVGFLLSMVIGMAFFNTIGELLWVILVFVAVKGFENWFLYPKIVGKQMGMHFIAVLMSLVFFAKIFGFWGLFLAIPITAIFLDFFKEYIVHYKTTDFYRGKKE